MAKYKLEFLPDALKEWKTLDPSIRSEFKKVLAKRLEHPLVESARLKRELRGHFKIKLRKSGYRLGPRANSKAYDVAKRRKL